MNRNAWRRLYRAIQRLERWLAPLRLAAWKRTWDCWYCTDHRKVTLLGGAIVPCPDCEPDLHHAWRLKDAERKRRLENAA